MSISFPFQEDLLVFLRRYAQSTTSMRFAEFREQWHAASMDQIHSALPSGIRSVDFLFALLHSAAALLLLHETTKFRVGVLYTLWALYETQIETPRHSIPVTLDVFRELQQLHEDASRLEIVDALAILHVFASDRDCVLWTHDIPFPFIIGCVIDGIPLDDPAVGHVLFRSANPEALIDTERWRSLAREHDCAQRAADLRGASLIGDSAARFSTEFVNIMASFRRMREARGLSVVSPDGDAVQEETQERDSSGGSENAGGSDLGESDEEVVHGT